MNIKFILTLALSSSLALSGCGNFMSGFGQEAGANGSPDLFKSARGGHVSTCKGSLIKSNEGAGYLDMNGLPRAIGGNFICENGKPALPKDCQGREFRSEAELRAYWEKYQLPVGVLFFDCSSGTPKILSHQLKFWQQQEAIKPTCTDARGRKRPCV